MGWKKTIKRISLLITIVLLACAAAACGKSASTGSFSSPDQKSQMPQESPTNKEIFTNTNRDQLVQKAKAEGTVNLYTSMALEDSTPLVQAFEKKYDIKVVMWRASDENVLQRILTEQKAKRYDLDAVEIDGPTLETLYREKVTEEFNSPYFSDIPPAAIPKHKNWASTRFNFFVAAYNTNQIKKEDAPKTYEDFLNPKWKGKFVVEASDVEWYAGLMKYWGEEKGRDYFKKLVANEPQIRKGHTLVAELVGAGELPLTLTAYNQSAERTKKKGAPIEWVPLEPTIGRPNGVALAKNAPHPYAALLFADFVLSPDGQEIIKKRNRVPASTKIDTNLNKFKYIMVDPAIILDEWNKWNTEWEKLFNISKK